MARRLRILWHAEEEQLDAEKLKKVDYRYVYTSDMLLPNPDIIELITRPLKLPGRCFTRNRVLGKVVNYVYTHTNGIAA